MALREELETSGNWLFRWRSYLPIVLIFAFLAVMFSSRHPGSGRELSSGWEVFCLVVALVGLGIRALTIGQVPKGTSGRNTANQVADTLNTKGIYSLVRHPLYLGNFFMWLGVALMPQRLWLVLLFVLVFWLYYERIIFAEEEFLRRKFGQTFLDWAQDTPPFFPQWHGYRCADLFFSWRNVLRREYNGFFALILILFVFETADDYLGQGRLSFDTWWLVLLGFSFVLWLVLRSLKRHTRVLDSQGR